MKPFEKKNFLQQLGNQLKRLRIDNNRTPKEMASLLNITRQAYGNIERGESDTCITKLIILAAFYKINVLELIPKEYRTFESIHVPARHILN